MDCLFCRIINKELKGTIVYEDERIIAFKDIYPKAPVHILIVPRAHIPSINHLAPEDKELVGEMFLVAQKIAKDLKSAILKHLKELSALDKDELLKARYNKFRVMGEVA